MDFKTRNQISYVLIESKHGGFMTDERSYRGADAHLDQLTETNKIEEEWRQREIVAQKTLEIYLEEKVKGREEE